MRIRAKTGMRQPMAAPILRCRPDLVNGMPICRLILALAWEIPRNRFQENPPLFMIVSLPCGWPPGANKFKASFEALKIGTPLGVSKKLAPNEANFTMVRCNQISLQCNAKVGTPRFPLGIQPLYYIIPGCHLNYDIFQRECILLAGLMLVQVSR